MISAALDYFERDPFSDNLVGLVAEIEADLRTHFGEADAKRTMIRRRYDALLRRAALHEGPTGDAILAGVFVRAALRLAEQYREYFDRADVDALLMRERAALRNAADALVPLQVNMTVPADTMDLSRATAEETANVLAETAARGVPSIERAREWASDAGTSVASLFPRIQLTPGKVLAEATSAAEHAAIETDSYLAQHALLVGQRYDITMHRSAESVGLRSDHILSTLGALSLGNDTIEILRVGYERYFAGDMVSATHVIVPRLEEVVRSFLERADVPTTTLVTGLGPDGTASRTDDATFGTLLRRSALDGRSVQDILGADLHAYLLAVLNAQSGLNLRNEFAHGLARLSHCTGTVVGIATHLLMALAARQSDLEPQGRKSATPAAHDG